MSQQRMKPVHIARALRMQCVYTLINMQKTYLTEQNRQSLQALH